MHRDLETLPDLSVCTNLKRLDIGGNKLTAIESIRGCHGLAWLSIKNNNVSDLQPLR